jgi:hypothetical protein
MLKLLEAETPGLLLGVPLPRPAPAVVAWLMLLLQPCKSERRRLAEAMTKTTTTTGRWMLKVTSVGSALGSSENMLVLCCFWAVLVERRWKRWCAGDMGEVFFLSPSTCYYCSEAGVSISLGNREARKAQKLPGTSACLYGVWCNQRVLLLVSLSVLSHYTTL